jgi:hypothetical protein
MLGGLLDGVLDNLFVFGRTDRGLRRLEEQGELVPATIYAIRVVRRGDGDEWSYGLDLVTSAGPLRASVRQQLIPDAWRAPLGARVLARHLDGRVAIDWPATLDELGVEHQASFIALKTLRTPLQAGIDDNHNRRRLRDGVPGEALVVASEPVTVFGMPTENRRLQLRVESGPGAPRTVVLERDQIPPYAEPLARAGVRLPVVIDPDRPDRVTIDWPRAAESAAG